MVAHGVAVSCALKDSEPSLAGDRQFDMTRNGADAARNSENRRRRAIVNNCNLKPNAEHDPHCPADVLPSSSTLELDRHAYEFSSSY